LRDRLQDGDRLDAARNKKAVAIGNVAATFEQPLHRGS
jgi:hypothetical protein